MSDKTTKQLFREFDQAIVEGLMIPNSWLPEAYRGKRSHRKLSSVVSQAKRRRRNIFRPGREVSVKFDAKRNIVDARAERLAVLEAYAANADEIQYQEDQDKLYRAQQAFVGALVAGGIIDADDLEE